MADITTDVMLAALVTCDRFQLSYWDAAIRLRFYVSVAVETARMILEATIAGGNSAAAASDAYNLGKSLLRAGRWEASVRAFEQAASFDEEYEERPYFHADLGASLFESGRSKDAVTRYERAIASGQEERWTALLADSLMYAGRYADADARFGGYLAGGGTPADSVWRLKHRVLADIRALAGDAQDRRPDEANELAERIVTRMTRSCPSTRRRRFWRPRWTPMLFVVRRTTAECSSAFARDPRGHSISQTRSNRPSQPRCRMPTRSAHGSTRSGSPRTLASPMRFSTT